jgi:hypothetical protein
MVKTTAFDSKDYRRTKATGEEAFFTPLGCGVTFSEPEKVAEAYNKAIVALAPRFGLRECCGAFSPSAYFREMGGKAIRFAEELLKTVSDQIDSVYFSYITLSSKNTPTVEVGGYRSPKKEINTKEYLRQISPHFAYITAWNYLGKTGRESETILIDGVQGKQTRAWDELTNRVNPLIMPHGDECNPLISIADIIAYLTDKKLYDNYFMLFPEKIEEVWQDYPFPIDTHFLDAKIISKIKWYSEQSIDATDYLARPMIFIKADGYKTEKLRELEVYAKATILAKIEGGGLSGFDRDTDSPKIKDNDIFIYAGEDSRKMCETLRDMYKIEYLSFRELSEKINSANHSITGR